MNTIATSPVASVSPASLTGGAGGEEARSVLSSDFETFIKMLTVQMENQDPLNPMESSDFATQLATFSGVEQQVKTNDLLQGLGGQLGALGVSQLSGWIGMEGRAAAPVKFEGSPITLTISGSPTAQSHELVVRDTFGNEVQRVAVSGDRQDYTWSGLDESGSPLLSGTYSINVESFSDDALVGTTQAQINSRIIEARLQGSQTILVMENGQEVNAAALLGLRQPQ